MSPPEPQTAVPNAKVRFKATFKGTPPFTVQWFKDDRELMTGPTCFTGLDGLSCFLELYSVNISQSGVYSCQVSNAAGSARSSANLTVKGLTFVFFAQLLCASVAADMFLPDFALLINKYFCVLQFLIITWCHV